MAIGVAANTTHHEDSASPTAVCHASTYSAAPAISVPISNHVTDAGDC